MADFTDTTEAPYLRLVFTTYWTGDPPSTELFYLALQPIQFNFSTIAAFEAQVVATLALISTDTPMRAIFIGYMQVDLSDDHVIAVGPHVLAPYIPAT